MSLIKKAIYLAHPLNAPTEAERELNRRNAAKWAGWLAKTFRVAVVADWIVLSSVWSEEDGRELGLECDKALIERCDGVFLCGPRISSGMQVELEHAMSIGKPFANWTYSNVLVPEDLDRRYLNRIGYWVEQLGGGAA